MPSIAVLSVLASSARGEISAGKTPAAAFGLKLDGRIYGITMAKPNYGFDKRQRELKKSKKQEEKRLKKQERSAPADPQPDDVEKPS